MDKCPLTGKPCPLPKTIHITEVDQTQYKELNLCQECGAEFVCPNKKPPNKKDDLLVELVEQIFNSALEKLKSLPPQQQQNLVIPESNKACPGCGWALSDIAVNARMGCSECYDFFKQDLQVVLDVAQGKNAKHVGKVPKEWLKRKQAEEKAALETLAQEHLKLSLEDRIASLEDKMKKFVSEENYESAAAVRDAIKVLKQELPS